MGKKRESGNHVSPTSWDPVAEWYNGWVGQEGSKHHRQAAIPALLELLEVQPGEEVLDLGAGQGVLAPYIAEAGAKYTGVDASPQLLKFARQHHGKQGKFILGDVCKLRNVTEIKQGGYDAAVFLLSIQDMNPLGEVLKAASWALKEDGRMVIMMTHPCFRVPRQSGWGWDEERQLRFRRVDRYLTPLPVPMKPYQESRAGVTLSFHRPLEEYINGLAEAGLLLDRIKEIPTYKVHPPGPKARAENLANREIPLFLGLRARKLGA